MRYYYITMAKPLKNKPVIFQVEDIKGTNIWWKLTLGQETYRIIIYSLQRPGVVRNWVSQMINNFLQMTKLKLKRASIG